MVLLAQNTNLTACVMQKVLRIQPGWTVFPIWVRTKINYTDSLAQDIDSVKLRILYMVFYKYFSPHILVTALISNTNNKRLVIIWNQSIMYHKLHSF